MQKQSISRAPTQGDMNIDMYVLTCKNNKLPGLQRRGGNEEGYGEYLNS